jgi:Flp pilus assembly pilin Flp
MAAYLLNFWQDEDGQDLIEYTLLICVIALACAALMGQGRPLVNNVWTTSNNQLTQASQFVGGS